MTVSLKTKKKLFAVSRNQCAFENCNDPIWDKNEDTIMGEISHIRSPKNKGPRHDPDYVSVNSLENLILLCPKHHKIVDNNPDRYTVEKLTTMKEKHENAAAPIEEPSDSLVRRLLTRASGIEVNIEDSEVRDIININVKDQKGDIMVGTWDPASNIAHNINHNVGYQENSYKSNETIVYCIRCGATPGEKSVCNNLTGFHNFIEQ